jgi:hypothetical protein
MTRHYKERMQLIKCYKSQLVPWCKNIKNTYPVSRQYKYVNAEYLGAEQCAAFFLQFSTFVM